LSGLSDIGQDKQETTGGESLADRAAILPSATGVLTVDLGAIGRNYRTLRERVAPAECAGVVKADAYGLGLRRVVPALAAEDCRTFFVATLAEAKALREVEPRADLYVLDGLFPGTAAEFRALDAKPVLSSLDELAEWEASGAGPAALHIDTGMNRLGVKPSDYAALLEARDRLLALPVDLVISHLACADTPEHHKNAAQLAAFADITAQLPGIRRSLANSAACFLGPDYAFDLARPGVALYGGNPLSGRRNPMEPVIRLEGRIAQLGVAERGDSIGYGAAKTLTRRTRYATVATGYADGYFRALGSSDAFEGAIAEIDGHRLPILGRVSMDLIVFDITDLPEGLARRGRMVELINERFTIDDVAALAGTIPYEVLTSLGQRYQRIYTGLQNGA
jgi:alanine racemase